MRMTSETSVRNTFRCFFSIANDVRREFGSGRKSNSVNGAKDGRTTGTGSGYRFCFSE